MRVQYRYTGGPGDVMVAFSFEFEAAAGVDFMVGKHIVTGNVSQAGSGGADTLLGDSPGCITDGKSVAC